MTAYYIEFVSDTKWTKFESSLVNLLSAERREKCMRYRFDADKILCLYSGLLIRAMIKKKSGLQLNNMTFGYEKYGKPFLKENRDIHFSISHTRNAVFCAEDDSPIGVDTENISVSAPFSIAEMYFHEKEKNYIADASSYYEKTRCFYEVWTKKEALLKCRGTGICDDISKINVLSHSLNSFVHDDYMYTICGSAFTVPKKITKKEILEILFS